jgi:hypothetical protein
VKIGGNLPADDGKKADRAPSNDLRNRENKHYADDFLAGLQEPHLFAANRNATLLTRRFHMSI